MSEPGTTVALEAERKLISVLFADIRGSTAMIGALDPEDALARLGPIIEAMASAVHGYGGIISKEQGDGIMAFFGAPIAVDDHAARACLAALAVHDEVKSLDVQDLQVRVGVHSGEVVLHRVTRDFSSVYDAAGAVVHLARKLEASAPVGTTLISGDCLRLTGNRFTVKSAGVSKIVGVEPMPEVYQLVAARPVSRWEGRASAGLSVFVGRRSHLDQLRGWAEEASSGAACRAAVIEGDAGNGKSRLAHQFLDWARAEGWTVWEVAAESTTQVPWAAARNLLSTAFANRHLPAAATMADIAANGLIANDEERCALGSLFGLPADSPAWHDSDPEYRRRLAFTAIARVILHAISSIKGPVAILIEDQHWIDAESDEAVNRLIGAATGHPVLFVITRRPHEARTNRLAGVPRLPLGALPAAEAGELLDHLLGDHPSLGLLKERIVVHTGGVPLFIEEIIRRLIDNGALVATSCGYRLDAPVEALGIPSTVQAVIAGRIDRLPRSAREILQTAAVLGQRVSMSHLRAMLDTEVGQIDTLLRKLHEAALLLLVEFGHVEELVFAHDLIHEVSYGSMVRSRRRELHLRALRALSSLYAQEAEPHAELLYRHAAGAEEWAQALTQARIAAARAIEQSAYRKAAELFEAALSALSHIEPSQTRAELDIDLRLQARIAFGATAQLGKLVAHAQQAEAIALSIRDTRRALAAALQKASGLTFLGVPEDAIAAGAAVLQTAVANKASEIEIVARYILGQAHFTAGNFRQTANLMAEAREHLGDKPLHRLGTTGTTLALVHVMEAVALASMGDFEVARSAALSAREIATTTGRPYDAVAAAWGGAFAALSGEDAEAAISIAEPALAVTRQRSIVFFFPLLASQLGQAYAAIGRLRQSTEVLREALATAEQLGHVASRVSAQSYLAQTLYMLGRWHEADTALVRSHETAKQQGFKALQSSSARLLAIVRANLGASADECGRLLVEAVDIAMECDAQPQAARARLTLAESLLRVPNDERAASELSQAVAAFRKMRMARSLRQAEELSRRAGLVLG